MKELKSILIIFLIYLGYIYILNKKESDTMLVNNSQEEYPKIEVISGEKNIIGRSKNGYTIYQINGLTYVDDILIVNKTYSLPPDYYPKNTLENAQNVISTCNKCLDKTVLKAFHQMQADAQSIGLNIYISSGYRPYFYQEKLYQNYCLKHTKDEADKFSARPGHSEHQTGLAFDLNTINDNFITTPEGKWINTQAYLYGFIIRYPKNKETETGYKYEPWHLRYVGQNLATKLYNNGTWQTIEDYYGLESTYPN